MLASGGTERHLLHGTVFSGIPAVEQLGGRANVERRSANRTNQLQLAPALLEEKHTAKPMCATRFATSSSIHAPQRTSTSARLSDGMSTRRWDMSPDRRMQVTTLDQKI